MMEGEYGGSNVEVWEMKVKEMSVTVCMNRRDVRRKRKESIE